jgi:hypothetical protein
MKQALFVSFQDKINNPFAKQAKPIEKQDVVGFLSLNFHFRVLTILPEE